MRSYALGGVLELFCWLFIGELTTIRAKNGSHALESMNTLTQKILDKDPKVRIYALEDMTVYARGCARNHAPFLAIDLVRKVALNDPDLGVRAQAMGVLGAAGPCAFRAVPDLISVLRDKRSSLRGDAVDALGSIGPDACRAFPEIVKLLSDKHALMRETAARALGKIGADATGHVAHALTVALHDKDSNVRTAAAVALLRVDVENALALQTLRVLLHDPKRTVRCLAACSVSDVGVSAKPLVPALIDALGDKDKRVRQMTALTLQFLGPTAKAAVPALTRLLRDPAPEVRIAGAEALQAMGSTARAALPELRRAQQKDGTVRLFASQAIRAISEKP